MNTKDFDDMFNNIDELGVTKKVDTYIPDNIGRTITEDEYGIDYDVQIQELKSRSKIVEDEYRNIISNLDLTNDELVEDFTKKELVKSIIIEQTLASKVSAMLDIILLQIQKDPTKDRTHNFIQIVDLQTKINSNVVKTTEKVNKVINDRKNAERQELRVQTMINNKTENNTLMIGDKSNEERMIINMNDLQGFAETGQIEAVKQIDVKNEGDVEILD